MLTVIVSIGAEDPQTSERVRNLEIALMALRRQTLPRDRYRIVLVEQGVQSRLHDSIVSLVDEHIFAYNPEGFNRSWGRNVGAVRAAPGVICTFDADLVVPPGFLQRGLLAWQCGARAIKPFRGILYMDPESTRTVCEEVLLGHPINCRANRYRGALHLRSKGGCLWTDTALYRELGGHDERFEGWGNEDNEFWDRLIRHTQVVALDGRLLHLYHDRTFEKTPESRGNSIFYHALRNGLLPPPKTKVVGDIDRYRSRNGRSTRRASRPDLLNGSFTELKQEQRRSATLDDATLVCRAPDAWDGRQPERLRTRALLAARHDDDELALASMIGAIRQDPSNVAYLLEHGRLLLRAGRATDALSTQLRALVIARDNAAPYRAVGRTLYGAGRLKEALLAYQEALFLDLKNAEIMGELGDVFRAVGRLDQALCACELAIKVTPNALNGFVRLGRVRLARGEWELALNTFRQGLTVADMPDAAGDFWFRDDDTWSGSRPPSSLSRTRSVDDGATIDPRHVALHVGAGEALRRLGRNEEAAASFRRALNLAPRDLDAARGLVIVLETCHQKDDAVGAWVSLGGALEARHRFDEAIVAYGQALSYKTDCLRALIQRGRVHATQGDLQKAIDCFERILAVDGEQPLAHTELGRARAASKEIDAGWQEFGWWCHPLRMEMRAFLQPLWDGATLDGRTLLVWADQELGDTIHWIRYVPALRQLGARVVVECQSRLVSLIRTVPGVDLVVGQHVPLPAFDVHVPLTLLPIVSTVCRSTPTEAPYLRADPRLVELWHRRLAEHAPFAGTPSFTVGLCWAGHPDGINAAFRFAPLAAFAPLAGLSHVRFVSLQMGPHAAELLGAPAGLDIEHLQDESCSAADTAALMESLDLILTVDTMVAHLAGALGRPVWLVLPHVSDWRWLMEGSDTPLYPTIRLFRQSKAGDWNDVFRRVRLTLAQIATTTRSVSA